MSYDIRLTKPACDHCGRSESTEFSWNFTSNCVPMWTAAGAPLKDFEGKTAEECLPHVLTAIRNMEADPEKFRAMDSPNGWGTYANLLPALRRLAEGMRQRPRLWVEVSR